jgi:hypothetical protein|tara:strand:- start:159 stop:497 length:339 start_codon:yes stop_codon:yes gene_type:complete
MQEIMMAEFKILSKYLSGVECSDSYLEEIFEAKFGKQKLNFINRMWIVIYFRDLLSIVGLYKDLNTKLLFIVALLEVSPDHKKIFTEKPSILLKILLAPFLLLAFLASLFLK